MLKINHVKKVFRGPEGPINAVDTVSLRISSGEVTAIHGPSGCGKTTLLLMAGTLLHPTEGSVAIGNHDVYKCSSEKQASLRGTQIGFVFQRFHLVPYLSVVENIRAASVGDTQSIDPDRCEQLLETLNLGHRRSHLPSALSTGERQRTVVARALVNEPQLLLADEATGNLDERNADLVMSTMRNFAGRGGAVLAVSHDPRATEYADTSLGMDEGRIVENR